MTIGVPEEIASCHHFAFEYLKYFRSERTDEKKIEVLQPWLTPLKVNVKAIKILFYTESHDSTSTKIFFDGVVRWLYKDKDIILIEEPEDFKRDEMWYSQIPFLKDQRNFKIQGWDDPYVKKLREELIELQKVEQAIANLRSHELTVEQKLEAFEIVNAFRGEEFVSKEAFLKDYSRNASILANLANIELQFKKVGRALENFPNRQKFLIKNIQTAAKTHDVVHVFMGKGHLIGLEQIFQQYQCAVLTWE